MQLLFTSYVQDIKPGLGQKQVRREGISQWPPGAHSLVRKTEGAQTQELYLHTGKCERKEEEEGLLSER